MTEAPFDNGGGFLGGLGGLQTMGILNALKTGDVVMDMIIAMCIPVLIRVLFSTVGRMESLVDLRALYFWFFHPRNKHHRYVTYRSTRNMYGSVSSTDPDSQNTVLLKAIQLYVHSQIKLNLKSASLSLTTTQDMTADLSSSSSNNYYYDYDNRNQNDADEEEDKNSKTIVGILSKYKIIKNPPSQEWHDLGLHGKQQPLAKVELRIEEEDHTHEGDGDSEKKKTSTMHETVKTFHFMSSQGHAIDDFIDKAYAWYMEELRKTEDKNSRYYYDLISSASSSRSQDEEGGSTSDSSGNLYARYKLSDEKTFDSLFFRQKKSLLQIVDNFQTKSGKYAISGYPHKLGILLHGPPGTGKTSLIKSLAHYTKRSIVNVPLSRITTNAELTSIFFDKRYQVQGQYAAVRLNFKDVIFVMEDVDAASGVVKRRDGKKTADVVQTEQVDLPLPNWWKLLLQSREEDCKELCQLLMEKSERLKEFAQKPEVLLSIAQRMMVLPGLGLVGEQGQGEDPAIRQLSEEAVESANKVMEKYEVVDRFLANHSRTLKTLLDAGSEVDEEFEDALLGISLPAGSKHGNGMIVCPPRNVKLSRDVSYTKYESEDGPHVEASGNTALLAAASAMQELWTDQPEPKEGKSTKAGPSIWASKLERDRLNLTGLLNVLDGVVDTPGRILIMTTNHPEHLDPALIRPGRIDKKIKLGFMASPDVIAMLEHYYQCSLSLPQVDRIERVISGDASEQTPQLNLTPAQIEQMTAEYEDLEEMIDALEEKCLSSRVAPVVRFGVTASKSSIAYGF